MHSFSIERILIGILSGLRVAAFRTCLIGLKETVDVVAILYEFSTMIETPKNAESISLAAVVMWS